ncbi:MAG: 14-3-3 family protein [archaeon]|nr:14-3-3 family protein [archaeon]
MTQTQIIELIYLSQKLERYDDLIVSYETLFKLFPNYLLKLEEISPLEIGFKSLIAEKQKKLKKLENLLNYSKGKEEDFENSTENLFFNRAIVSQGKQLEKEIELISKKILFLFDNYVMKNLYSTKKEIDREMEIFILRIKGDIYKYLSFVDKNITEKKQKIANAKMYYEDAYKYCLDYLKPENLSYINCVICYSKFMGLFEKNAVQGKIIVKELIEKLNSISDLRIKKRIADKINELYDVYNILEKNSPDL